MYVKLCFWGSEGWGREKELRWALRLLVILMLTAAWFLWSFSQKLLYVIGRTPRLVATVTQSELQWTSSSTCCAFREWSSSLRGVATSLRPKRACVPWLWCRLKVLEALHIL